MIRLLVLYSTLLFKTFALQHSINNCFNVGTVLFTIDDLKKDWSQESIDLLRARRHFQALLEPLTQYSSSVDDKSLKSLFDYFKDSYNFINSESPDTVTGSILTAALSDVLGGYLKCWVLPVTKYAYYGGMVSSENTQKVLKLYDDIKEYLETDGSNWHNADSKVLSSVVIDVVPVQRYRSRSIYEPCKRLAYFEKTSEGLSIPTPSINWDSNSRTVFLPLKDQSLVSLCSTNAFTVLTNYYDISRGCINSMTPERSEEFEDKFQSWLRNEIVPHLNDDGVYIGLGGILSLMDFQPIKPSEIDYNKFSVISLLQSCKISRSVWKYVFIILGIIWLAFIIWRIMKHNKQPTEKSSSEELKDSIMKSSVTSRASTAVEYVQEAEKRLSTIYKKGLSDRDISTKSEHKLRSSKHSKSNHNSNSLCRTSQTSKCTVEISSMTDQKSSKHQLSIDNKPSKHVKSSELCKYCSSTNTVTLVRSTPDWSKHSYTPHRLQSSSSVASETLVGMDSFCNMHRDSKTKNTCLFCIKEVDVCSSSRNDQASEPKVSKESLIKNVNSILISASRRESDSKQKELSIKEESFNKIMDKKSITGQGTEYLSQPLMKKRPSRIPMKMSTASHSPEPRCMPRSSSPIPETSKRSSQPNIKPQRTYTIMTQREQLRHPGFCKPGPKYSRIPHLVRGTVDDSIIKKRLKPRDKLNITL